MPSLDTTTGLVELRHEESFAQSETLYFTIRADDARAALLGEDMEIRWRSRTFFIFEPRKYRGSDGAALIEYECPALWNRLADTKRLGVLELFGLTVQQGLDLILGDVGWTGLVASDVDLVTTWYLNSNDASVLDLVRKWAKITGTEVDFDTATKTVALRQQIGADRGVGFRYGRNVKTVERRSNPPAVTVLYPYGRDDLNIAAAEPSGLTYLEDFSFYTDRGLTLTEARARYTREEVWVDTSFTTAEDLYAGAVARLAIRASERISFEMTVADLAELTQLSSDVYGLGDSVRVYDGGLGFNVTTRVVRIVRRPLEPWASEVELSYLPPFVPDPSVGSARTDPGAEWLLFEYSSPSERQIRNGSTILARLNLTTIPSAEWIIGYSLQGVGVGTGSLTVQFVDDISGESFWPTWNIAISPGLQVRENFTLANDDVPPAVYKLTVRAFSNAAGVGLNINSNGAGASTPDPAVSDWLALYGQTMLVMDV